MQQWLGRLRAKGLPAREGALAVSVGLLYLLVAPIGIHYGGLATLGVAALAAIVCLTGAGAALAISHVLRSPAYGMSGLLLSMAVRMGLPLMVLIVVHLLGGLWDHRTLVYHFVIFYLASLAVETFLSLPAWKPAASTTGANAAGPG